VRAFLIGLDQALHDDAGLSLERKLEVYFCAAAAACGGEPMFWKHTGAVGKLGMALSVVGTMGGAAVLGLCILVLVDASAEKKLIGSARFTAELSLATLLLALWVPMRAVSGRYLMYGQRDLQDIVLLGIGAVVLVVGAGALSWVGLQGLPWVRRLLPHLWPLVTVAALVPKGLRDPLLEFFSTANAPLVLLGYGAGLLWVLGVGVVIIRWAIGQEGS